MTRKDKTMQNKRIIVYLIATVCVFVLFSQAFAGGGFIVIVNSSVAQNEISSKDLSDIYLGKKMSWDNGSKAAPGMLEGGATHESFTKGIIKKSASQFSTFWKQAIFTGQGIPPKAFSSEDELLKFVSSTAGAVGYLAETAKPEGVKILTIK